MEIFDCNVSYGVYSVPPPAASLTVKELVDQMAFCGIHRALVRHAAMRDESPIVGNPLLVDEIQPFEPLEGTWAILPHHTGELGSPDEFVERMGGSGIRALWAFPAEHKYLLNGTAFGPLFERMIERRILLFLPVSEISGGLSGWGLVDALLREFPKLRLVVTEHGSWGHDRYFRPLVERYEGLHIDTSRYELDGGIANFCRRYGPHRLLFGTAYPFNSMGGPLLTLAHADIRDEEKEAIFGGNLRRLLEEVAL